MSKINCLNIDGKLDCSKQFKSQNHVLKFVEKELASPTSNIVVCNDILTETTFITIFNESASEVEHEISFFNEELRADKFESTLVEGKIYA